MKVRCPLFVSFQGFSSPQAPMKLCAIEVSDCSSMCYRLLTAGKMIVCEENENADLLWQTWFLLLTNWISSEKIPGNILVSDVIDSDSWRLWPEGKKELMKDKQVYRNLSNVTAEGLNQVKLNFTWIADTLASVKRPTDNLVSSSFSYFPGNPPLGHLHNTTF